MNKMFPSREGRWKLPPVFFAIFRQTIFPCIREEWISAFPAEHDVERPTKMDGRHQVSAVPRGTETISNRLPATPWLAIFLGRFATKRRAPSSAPLAVLSLAFKS